jgi:hypothetical protein
MNAEMRPCCHDWCPEPSEWVVVHDGKVIGQACSLMHLADRMKETRHLIGRHVMSLVEWEKLQQVAKG